MQLPRVVTVVGVLVLCALGRSAMAEAPAPAPAPTPIKIAPRPAAPTAGKRLAKLELPSYVGVPGDTVILTATLRTADGSPVSMAPITFRLAKPDGQFQTWSASTGPEGIARKWIKVPRYAQAAYELSADYAGNATTSAAEVKTVLKIFKVMVKIGPKLDVTGNSPDFRWWTVEIKQKNTGETINSYVMVTIDNDPPRKIVTGQPLGLGKKSEPVKPKKVTVQFDGNDFAIAAKETFTIP